MSLRTSRAALFTAACLGMALFGVALVLPGLLFGLADFRLRLGVTDSVRQGTVQSVLMFGVFASTVLAGPLMDRRGPRQVMIFGSALLALALTAFATAHGYDAARACALLIGIGAGVLNIATNVVVSAAFGDDRGPKLNLLGIFFGVGALSLPLFSSLSPWFRFDRLLLISAGFAALAAAAYALLEFPRHQEPGASWGEMLAVARYPAVLLFAFLLFFESSNELALIGWTPAWALNAGATARAATLMLALFQAMMIAGRVLASQLLRRFSKAALVFACAAGSMIGAALLFAGRSLLFCWLAVALLGLFFAPVYQTVLAMAGDRYRRFPATVFGLLFSVALVGSFVSPLVIGRLAASFGIRSGALVPLAGAVAIAILIRAIRSRRETPSTGASESAC